MKKDALRGIVSLVLCAVLLSLAVAVLGKGAGIAPGGVLRTALMVLWVLAVVVVFLALKGRRLRMLVVLAAAVVWGLVLERLDLPRGVYFLAVAGSIAVYLLGCAWYNYWRLRRALEPLNEAALAYQKDQDGEKFLEALDRCAPKFPQGSVLKRADTGTVTFQEHIACERIEVLGRMGRVGERNAAIDRLRQETKREGLLRWLDEKEAESSITQE